MSPLDALDRFAFARALSEGARASIESAARLRMVGPRTPLVRRGEEAGGVFFVTHGAIRVYYVHPNGREGTLYWVDEKEACFLSLDCAFKEIPYPAWAETDDRPTQFVFVPAPLFVELYEREPAARRFAFDALSTRVFELMSLVEQSATLALEQRTASLLLKLANADGVVATSQDRLAGHLGTAREVLARILRTFRSRDLVETRRGRIAITNRGELEALAG
ncbi:MAG: Crp/Fnr family transcriptional regulator [Sandaracinaceae bacterium]